MSFTYSRIKEEGYIFGLSALPGKQSTTDGIRAMAQTLGPYGFSTPQTSQNIIPYILSESTN